jgi:hypothetical protein
MTKAPNWKIVINQFVRQNSRLFLIPVGVIVIFVLWRIQQNNVNQLDEKICKATSND